jgi:hypothetical protein
MEGNAPVDDASDPVEDLRIQERWVLDDLQETIQAITAKERELQLLRNRLTFLRTELAHIRQQIADATHGE